jgi:hypothetical protein
MYKILACIALAIAGALVALQILGALEYTAGGTLYTTASMIAAILCVAALPVFIEAARHLGAPVVGWALFVGFVALLAYSLPATVGRTGEVKEIKAQQQIRSAVELERIRADHAQTKALVIEAQGWFARECKSGNGKRCEGVTFILNQREASLEKLDRQLQDTPPTAGDTGSDALAWATNGIIPADAIRKGSGLAFAIGSEIVIWSLVWFATVAFLSGRRKASNDNRPSIGDTAQTSFPDPLPPVSAIPETVKGAEVIEWAKAFEKRHSRKPRLDEAQMAFGRIARTTLYRRLKAA